MRRAQIVISGLILLILSGCAQILTDIKTPQISLVSIVPVELSLFEQRFDLRLRVQNPNSVELPIRGMQYFLQLNGGDFAQGVTNQEINIPEYGEQVITVPVTTNLSFVFNQLKRLNRDSLSYKLNGTIALSNKILKLPFEYEGKIDFKF